MSIALGFRTRFKRLRDGQDTLNEFCLSYLDRISQAFGKETNFHDDVRRKRLFKVFNGLVEKKDGYYQLKDIKMPLLESSYEETLACLVLYDTFYSYLKYGDKYDEKTFDKCDKDNPSHEGLYGLINDKVNVTVEPGDIVIDAGSWIGDFAAYASMRGATTYAFEPTNKTFGYLEQTAKLNKNIIPVNKGLSDENISRNIYVQSSGSTFLEERASADLPIEFVETVRLDDFVRENNLPRVDFIKADIEGFERHMLAGAQEVLREFAPKLALCTYHLPDDPEVMADLIMKANPKYNIVQKKKKLFASVPK